MGKTKTAATPDAHAPERRLFYGCFALLGATMAISHFVALPVLLQMIVYTVSIVYIGSHASLKQNEVDEVTGERSNKGEAMNHTDAMLFPVFGSLALCSLYIAYKFLDASWVNFLLTLYLTAIGLVALGETLHVALVPLFPDWANDPSRISFKFCLPHIPFICPRPELSTPSAKEAFEASCTYRLSYSQLGAYILAAGLSALWLWKKHWAIHNLLGVAFCIQASRREKKKRRSRGRTEKGRGAGSIEDLKRASGVYLELRFFSRSWSVSGRTSPARAISLVSVGNFTVATILLSGLFIYDIFWVFGTDVMVTVAKSFEGPAKLIFPVNLDPWQHSILGLGDIVIPGVFISMCLRFDYWLATASLANASEKKTAVETSIDIHQKFSKFYFFVVLVFYEFGLLTTGVIMLVFQHPQPALLYIVPFCLFSLFGAAALNGQVKEVLAYREDEEEKPAEVEGEAEPTEEKKSK
ncbi:putative signal peptide peptidase domain-containing protein [Neospora caninum Liverpool]|uniref:Putative signal peptide peptidase domain-containing protein n=1 Tax=Neospora caninum (strain Liverpool) TaxID=572307 RepID=F0VKS3_NEOCL|nr:putative signal peptide peptidase domain-containing protein [Neospora caninum Liverpool]CBZ54674.1 putative signal peptide peptidase domain-containing protein [Neospora caninum Liverpool]|eukprot:XP_003884704.1 putative signal peptide peptidase domain-containing protein [Neospora caninum Liverpool]